MKKYLITLNILLFFFSAHSQNFLPGLWEGVLNAGVDLHMVFHISQSEKEYSATLGIPDQGIKDIQASAVIINKDSISIEISKYHGVYKGHIDNDSLISGLWIQGKAYVLNIKKVDKIAAIKRPQTPQPPYPYISEDVIYRNISNTINYGATITIPKGTGPFPAILLITGAGQQNRDEEMLGHRPFAVIADFLTRNGYIVMRVDDRGMGLSTGNIVDATSRDFANDAEISLNFLKKIKGVDSTHLGLLGHSEGGLIAQLISAERNDIDFLIFLAAPGEKIKLLMEEQHAAIMRTAGMKQEYIDAFLVLYRSMLTIITTASTLDNAKLSISKLIDKWKLNTEKNIVISTTGISNDSTQQQYVNELVPSLYSPWYRYFLNYDPNPYFKKIKAKVLALNGDKDVQVISKTNLPLMEMALKKNNTNYIEVKELAGLNHLFQHCHLCNVQEYGQLEETIAPEVLKLIADWLKMNIH